MKRYGRIPTLGDTPGSFNSGAYAAGMNAMYLQAQPGSGVDANKVIVAALANPELNNPGLLTTGSVSNNVQAIQAATAAPSAVSASYTPYTPSVDNTVHASTPATTTTTPIHVTLTDPKTEVNRAAFNPSATVGYLVNGQMLKAGDQIPSGFIAVGYTPNGITVYGPPGSPQGIYDFSSGRIVDGNGKLIGLINSGGYPTIAYDDKGNALTSVPAGFVQVGNAANGLPIFALSQSGGGSSSPGPVTSDASAIDSSAVNAGQGGGSGFMVVAGIVLLVLLLNK